MDLPMIKRLKELEEENARLKKMFAEVSMDKEVLNVLHDRTSYLNPILL